MNLLSNINTYHSWLFADALAHAGLTAVVIAPGSRSTPLTLAFDAHPAIAVHLHVDERGAAFLALGLALATDRPVALVCTSGTAVANFMPAIVEAKMSHVPLLILTSDRPHELRHSGANQTIDQVKIYGDQVLWSVDMPIPQADAPAVVERYVQTTAVRAYAIANGLPKGAVHINFPFRTPLQWTVDSGQWSVVSGQKSHQRPATSDQLPATTSHQPLATIERGELILSRQQQEGLAAVINQHERGLIICGPRCPGGNFPQAVRGLAEISGYPILADPLSGLRWDGGTADTIIGGYETFLQADRADLPQPEVVVRFGAVPTSKWLNAYLDQITPAQRIHIRENGVWADDSQRTTHFIQANAEMACYQMSQFVTPRFGSAWVQDWQARETAVWQALTAHLYEPYFDGAAVADAVELLPPHANLLIGNSLAVRHLDQFGRPSAKPLHIFGNRGASGIDGNISTGLGIALANQQPTLILIGDITFLHDLNGLLATRQPQFADQNITIVVINNNGGGIFRRLPISQIDPPFTDLFLTPHDLTFAPAAQLFGLQYHLAEDRAQFRQALTTSWQNGRLHLIELRTNGQQDDGRRRELLQKIRRASNE